MIGDHRMRRELTNSESHEPNPHSKMTYTWLFYISFFIDLWCHLRSDTVWANRSRSCRGYRCCLWETFSYCCGDVYSFQPFLKFLSRYTLSELFSSFCRGLRPTFVAQCVVWCRCFVFVCRLELWQATKLIRTNHPFFIEDPATEWESSSFRSMDDTLILEGSTGALILNT